MPTLPQYLQHHEQEQTYGELSFNHRTKCWKIKAEPMVIEFAKRLFPSALGSRRGEIQFSNHTRFVADLNWLMLRYPLSIKAKDKLKWKEALQKAQQAYVQNQERLKSPKRLTPPKVSFCGELTPFQEEGCAYLTHTPRALLADEMGLGKTVQALATLASLEQYPCLIVVPSHLVHNWVKEIERFLKPTTRSIQVHVIKGLKPYDLPHADIYIIHYLLLRGWKHYFQNTHFPMTVFDEIQELRHGGTEKYSVASQLANSSDRVIGLSGTPIYNHGGEIWHIVNILDFHFLGTYDAFTKEWCYGYGNGIVVHPDKLGQFLCAEGLMLRRRKDDVLTYLPPKRRVVNAIHSDSDAFKKYMQPALSKLTTWGKEHALSERSLIALDIHQHARRATGLAKLPYIAQFVRMLLECEEKVLLFAHHHDVFDAYKKALKEFKPTFITGRETTAQKAQAVQKFTDGKTNLCCVSLRSAVGLNLQRATCVVFAELDWSPAVHSQAEDRAHRIGKEDSLLCYYLVSQVGCDVHMQDCLGLKVSQFKSLMQDDMLSYPQEQNLAQIAINYANELFEQYVARKNTQKP